MFFSSFTTYKAYINCVIKCYITWEAATQIFEGDQLPGNPLVKPKKNLLISTRTNHKIFIVN